MMRDSVLTTVDRRNRDTQDLPLSGRGLARSVHYGLVQAHVSSHRLRSESVYLEDVVDPARQGIEY